jgi:hypothetical protein
MGLTIVWATLTGGAMLTMALLGTRTDFAVLLPAVAAALSALGSLAFEAGRGREPKYRT